MEYSAHITSNPRLETSRMSEKDENEKREAKICKQGQRCTVLSHHRGGSQESCRTTFVVSRVASFDRLCEVERVNGV